MQIIGTKGTLILKNLWFEVYKIVRPLSGPYTNRRLSLVYDPESKTRVIGIVDYFTQVILAPVAKQMFTCLRSIPQDRTFTQDPHIVAPEGNYYHSIDLKAATDRFPLWVQKVLLSEMTDKNFAHA